MALAPSLLPGFQYEIISGNLAGEVVTIVDNTPFPDSDPHRRRKITASYDGETFYILPRLLGDKPVGIASKPVPAPEVVSAAVSAPVAATQAVLTDRSRAANPITDPMDPRLDHLRPSVSKCKRYVRRTMVTGKSDVETLLNYTSDAYRAENQGRPANLALKGDTQSGKTFLVEVLAVEWAKQMGLPKPLPVFTLSGSSGVTDFDLFGQTTSYTDPETGVESLVWLPGVVELASQVGGILYLDEINAMSERVTTSLFPILDHRHQFSNRNKPVLKGGQFMPETTSTSLDLWVIATYNEGYQGMVKMNQAVHQRFDHILWDYSDEVERKLIQSPTILLMGSAFRQARKARTLNTPIGTAVLQRMQRNVATLGVPMAVEVFLGMFDARERPVAEAILQDRSFITSLAEEVRVSAQA